MNLKSLLENHRISQRQFAEKMGISTSAVNNFVNHGIYPKKTTQPDFDSKINQALTDLGVLELYQPTPLPTQPENTSNPTEDDPMLLRKQTLSQPAKKQFGLFNLNSG